jgi:long-chain fatty acid transport protein
MAVMTVAAITGNSRAGGFASAQFGGAHGNAASDSLTSIFYNPAGLALDHGTRAYVEALAAYRSLEFTRDPNAVDDTSSQDAIDANSGTNKAGNVIASPFIAIASDLGQRGLAVAVGVHVPFGGQASWDQVDKWKGNQMYPGAADGPQRWSVTTGKQQSIFYTGAAAYRTADNRLSFGVAFNVIQSALQLTRARNVDGTDTETANGAVTEGRSLLDVTSIDVSLGFGFIAQLDEHTKIGASYQTQPLGGEQKMEGTLTNKFGDTGVSESKAGLRQRLPDSVRVGVEWQGGRHALRAGADWTHWALFKDQCIVDLGSQANCTLLDSGAFDPTAGGASPLLDIQRNWKDSWGLQGGGSWWPSSALELSLNLRLDTNAVPDSTLEPALMDANKLISMVGARYTKGKFVVDLSLADVEYGDRTTAPRAVDPEPPSRNPDMAGTYKQHVFFALIGLGFHQ